MVYQITYELKNPQWDYSGLFIAIKQLSNAYAHPITPLWFVVSHLQANDLYDQLVNHISRQTDKLIISETNIQNIQGWVGNEFWNWLRHQQS